MSDHFSSYHPLVNFLYFGFVLAFSMVFMHPLCLAISLVSSFIYSISLTGRRAVKFNFAFLLPALLLTALINPAFNHEGVTVLAYLPSGNPLTLESIIYGVAAATMLVTVICWFSCYNAVISSDKFIYLFGRIIPALSLIFSMVLRFVPKFKAQLKIVMNAQKCVGRDLSNGSVRARCRQAVTVISIMVTWALENAIETADSMRSRGYGLPGRSAFSIYRLDGRDKKALLFIALLGIYIIVGGALGGLYWRYFPSMLGVPPGLFSISLMVSYLLLCLTPCLINIGEGYRWRISQAPQSQALR